jgi:hypothetical protein
VLKITVQYNLICIYSVGYYELILDVREKQWYPLDMQLHGLQTWPGDGGKEKNRPLVV